MERIDTNSGFWDKFFAGGAEFNRYSIISGILLVVGCLGGLTVGFGAIHNTFQLILVVIPTMVTLSLLLALAPMKQILGVAVLTIVIDVIILIINFMS
tara:strand:+ start:563 stop:856 length:294 start_codon:yes stop_codon:yes gene_type:complete